MEIPQLSWKDHKNHWRLSLQLAGDEVGALWTVKLRMRIGSAKVRTGGIKNVNTAEKHRLKGYASGGMQAAFELMKNSGYGMSILFGIPDFYHRFGYAAVFPESWLYVKTTDLLRAEARGATQNMKRKTDLPEMLRWYNRNNSERTGSVIRTKSWRYRRPVARCHWCAGCPQEPDWLSEVSQRDRPRE